jgi:hypothetical protein
MLADQVDPAGCRGSQTRRPAKQVPKDRIGLPLLVCHGRLRHNRRFDSRTA